MPNYKGHIVGSSLFFAGAYPALVATQLMKPSVGYEVVALFVLCLIGGLFPDIDIRSKGQKLFYQGLFILLLLAIAYQRYELLIPLTLVSLFPLVISHRGITHNPWFIIFLSSGLPLAAHWYHPELKTLSVKAALFFAIGGWSHLILDWGTVGFCKRLFKI